MKYKNNNLGAKVLIPKLLKNISPEKGWEFLKNIEGIIVENLNYEQYYYTSSGGNTHTIQNIL